MENPSSGQDGEDAQPDADWTIYNKSKVLDVIRQKRYAPGDFRVGHCEGSGTNSSGRGALQCATQIQVPMFKNIVS